MSPQILFTLLSVDSWLLGKNTSPHNSNLFPISNEAAAAFEALKRDTEGLVVTIGDIFTVETPGLWYGAHDFEEGLK